MWRVVDRIKQVSEEDSNPLIALIETHRLRTPILVTGFAYDAYERFCTMQVLSEIQRGTLVSILLYLSPEPMTAAGQAMMCVTDAARNGLDVTLGHYRYVGELWPWTRKYKPPEQDDVLIRKNR